MSKPEAGLSRKRDSNEETDESKSEEIEFKAERIIV